MTPHRIKTVLICVGLFVGTLLLFSRALHNEFLDLDDPDYVTHNAHVQAGLTWATLHWTFTSGDASNWHPLTWLSHALDCQLFGANPAGHHATSIVFHAINAVILFLVLPRLTRRSAGLRPGANHATLPPRMGLEIDATTSPAEATWLCAFSAALFAWHPLRVESVAWISERKDVLSVFFALLTLWSYAVFAGKQRAAKRGAKRFYALALTAFTAGLMCKPMLVTLPFLLLLLDYWPLQRLAIGHRSTPLWRLLAEKIPFLVLAAASCVITYLVQSNGGAVVENMPLSARLANAVVSLVRYLGKFLWPFDLAIGYPTPERWSPATVIGAALLLLAISALAVVQRERRPWLLVGWLWYLGTLVPVIGVVQVGLQAMADRYTYLPLLGIQIALLGAVRELERRSPDRLDSNCNPHRAEQVIGAPTLEERGRSNKLIRWLAPATALMILAGLAARTWDQLAVWHTPLTLHWHALAVTDRNYLAEAYLGTTLFNRGRFPEAAEHFRRAIEFKPNFRNAHYRLGRTMEQLRQPAAAAVAYRRALTLRPDDADAHYGLGAALEDVGRTDEAIASYREAVRLRPDFAEAQYNVGVLLLNQNQPAAALPHLEAALRLKPQFPGLAEALDVLRQNGGAANRP
jgi:Flp pilus assembly protein TadD